MDHFKTTILASNVLYLILEILESSETAKAKLTKEEYNALEKFIIEDEERDDLS